MFNKVSRCFLIPFLSFSIVCASGFCIWIFFDGIKETETLNGKVLLEGTSDYGTISFVDPQDLDYEQYRIVFEQGNNSELYDETKGIYLVPSLTFIFSDYHPDGTLEKPATMEGYSFYFYVDFTNTGVIFSENGYGKYISEEAGHSASTKQKIDVDWTSSTTRVSFDPVFHYREGKKPDSNEKYKKMLQDIYSDTANSIFTVHIVLEKEQTNVSKKDI